jgi:hypothetical protein
VLRCCGNELIERALTQKLSLWQEAQCGLNLSKAPSQNINQTRFSIVSWISNAFTVCSSSEIGVMSQSLSSARAKGMAKSQANASSLYVLKGNTEAIVKKPKTQMACHDWTACEEPTLLVVPLDVKCRLNRQSAMRNIYRYA